MRERTELIFRELLSKAYDLSDHLIDELIATRQSHPSRPGFVPTPLRTPGPGEAFRPSPPLVCPYAPYPPTSPFAALNRVLYIATDSRNPRADAVLELFDNTFPCWFVWQDFERPVKLSEEPVEQLDWLVGLKDKDGEAVGGMMVPFVEAMVAASADVVVGSQFDAASVALEPCGYPSLTVCCPLCLQLRNRPSQTLSRQRCTGRTGAASQSLRLCRLWCIRIHWSSACKLCLCCPATGQVQSCGRACDGDGSGGAEGRRGGDELGLTRERVGGSRPARNSIHQFPQPIQDEQEFRPTHL